MSSNSNDSVFTLYEYPIHSLPEHITESNLYIMTLDMYPDMTTFPFLESKMVLTLKVETNEDFQRLIEAEHMFGFKSNIQIQIFENMYNYWLFSPDSGNLPLPVKDFSNFGNQVRALFLESELTMPLNCFKNNYVELFDYLIKRDGLYKVDSGRFPDYTLPFYGAANNHIEIVRRGLEVGVSVAKDVIDRAIEQKNQEMFDLLVSYKVKYSKKSFALAASIGLPEMYKHFLKLAIENNMLNDFVTNTLKNKDNLEYLLVSSGTDLTTMGIDGKELLVHCISNACSVDIIKLVDAHFTKPDETNQGITLMDKMADYKQGVQYIAGFQYTPDFKYIPQKVAYNDDFELFTYLHSKGFLIDYSLIHYVTETHKTFRLTPGFLKRQYDEQQARLTEEKERIQHELQID